MPRLARNWLRVLCEEKHPPYINGKEIPKWQEGPTLLEDVNYSGAKGWMLRGDPSGLRLGSGKLTFIRPKQ